MKKVIALALALVMVLAMGVTSFAATTISAGGGSGSTDLGEYFYFFDATWDIDEEAFLIAPYDMDDAGTLLSGEEIAAALWADDYVAGDTLSSIKVESEKGIVDVTVYNLDDYVKSISDDGEVKTKSSWPFEDFDIQDLLDDAELDDTVDPDEDLNLFFLYFDFPTYAGAKVSFDNYFTLKFRENTTGADHVKTSEKVHFCIFPYAVDEGDVETYADEDEAMEFEYGEAMVDADMIEEEYDVDDITLEQVWFSGFDDEAVPTVITKDAWKEIVGSTLIVTDGNFEIEIGKIVKGQTSINFLTDDDVDDDVQAINEDAELAALLFLDTTNVLDSDFVISYTFEIEDAAKAGDYFLYELVGDELTLVKKVAVGKGDDEVEVEIERKAGDTLGQYYLSDVELSTATAEEGNEENPNTGASEVAGVAVALAVISLVSAAAVSLKK